MLRLFECSIYFTIVHEFEKNHYILFQTYNTTRFTSTYIYFSNNDIIEKVHLKFCKLILHLKLSTPLYMIYGEIGRYPLEIDIESRIISFWAKLLSGKEL